MSGRHTRCLGSVSAWLCVVWWGPCVDLATHWPVCTTLPRLSRLHNSLTRCLHSLSLPPPARARLSHMCPPPHHITKPDTRSTVRNIINTTVSFLQFKRRAKLIRNQFSFPCKNLQTFCFCSMFNEPAVKTACIKRSKIGARERVAEAGAVKCEQYCWLITLYYCLSGIIPLSAEPASPGQAAGWG